MPTFANDEEFERPTTRSGYRYLFTSKHHGLDASAAQWRTEMSLPEEFSVFELADGLDLSDGDGNMYGIFIIAGVGIEMLGSRDEQVAEFPGSRVGEIWHGYPCYPLAYNGARGRPAKIVFDKMVERGLLTSPQRRRLMKGKHI